MDLQTVLAQVESWPVEDRLRLMEQIWDGLLGQGPEPELTEVQKAEIDRRLADDDAAPDDVVSWDEVRADALRRAGR
jgi:putative addiction module component (TIGR02574 family)